MSRRVSIVQSNGIASQIALLRAVVAKGQWVGRRFRPCAGILLTAGVLAACGSKGGGQDQSSATASADEVVPECLAYEQAYRTCMMNAAGSKRREVAEQNVTRTHESLVAAMADPTKREAIRTQCADGTRRLAVACR